MKTGRSFNRRNFLKSGLLTTAGAMVASGVSATSSAGHSNDENGEIIYRELGKTGISLPIVSMGVMRADNPNLVRAALKKGIVHLDTAHVYQKGKNESMLGELLEEYDRSSFVISSKVKPEGLKENNFDARDFMEKLEISLERLKMDHVDILYAHSMHSREDVLNKDLIKTLKKVKKKGKAKFIGVSTHSNMAEVLDAAADSNFYDVVLTSYNFQLKDSEEMHNALQKANDKGIGIVAMKTMAGGFLDKERTRPVNAHAALKWALQNEMIHTSIPGYTSFEELEESFSVMKDLELTDKEREDLHLEDMSASLYCSGCRQCLPSCKKGLPVPDIMRAYMYTYGYRNFEKAQTVLASTLDSDSPCDDCDSCTVSCSKGFNVAERISDVARLRSVPAEFFT